MCISMIMLFESLNILSSTVVLICGSETVMPEGEKHWGCQYVVIGGDNLPSPVGIGLIDLPIIGGGPVAPLTPLAPLAPTGLT